MPQSAINTVENVAHKESVPDGIIFGVSRNYQVLDHFKIPNDKELDQENDNNTASDAPYKTKDSKELPSDSNLLRLYKDIEDSEIESLAGSTNQPGENNNQNEDEISIDENVGANANEEAGVNAEQEVGVNDDEIDSPVDIREAGMVSESEVADDNKSNDSDYESDHNELQNNEHDNNGGEESNDDAKETLQDSDSKNNNQIWHPRMLKEIQDHLQGGQYWAITAATVTEFSKMEVSKGLKLFGKDGYEATVVNSNGIVKNLISSRIIDNNFWYI